MFVYEEDLQACLAALQKGAIILYPTDTVWGIGCDATNEAAVAKIFALKKRTDTKAMIVLVEEEQSILNYVEVAQLQVFDYIKGIHKPTTVIYQKDAGLLHCCQMRKLFVEVKNCYIKKKKKLIFKWKKKKCTKL